MSGSISRRAFVQSAALLAAVVGVYPWREASAALDAADAKFEDGKYWVAELGNAGDFGPAPKLLNAKFKNSKGELMEEAKIYVRAVGSGSSRKWTVLSAICTHLKCKIDYLPDKDKFKCNCHKSEFSLEGKVLMKPAKKDLPDFSGLFIEEDGKAFLRRKAD